MKIIRSLPLLIAIAINLLFAPNQVKGQPATFTITFNNFTPQAEAAFQYAAKTWSGILISKVPIKVNAYFIPLTSNVLGVTFPNGIKNFTGAPLTNTWYATSLANSIAGQELNTGQMDFDLFLNSSITWYFDTTGTPGFGQYDFISTATHEICHGLGFIGLEKVTGDTGSIGLLKESDFSPIVTSFPWPNLDTLPSAFDHLLVDSAGNALIQFTNPSLLLGKKFTSNEIFISGPNILAANGNKPGRIYAPSTFSLGSSMIHLDEATYPVGNVNEMMTPEASPGVANHNPGPITLGILKDIGWNLNATGIDNLNKKSSPDIVIYPNPTDKTIIIEANSLTENCRIEITDMVGRVIYEVPFVNNKSVIDLSPCAAGIYFVNIHSAGFNEVKKLMKY